MKNYEEFLNKKIKEHKDVGFDVDENKLNKNLFDFQRFIVKQALKKGKYAIFANIGLGKTLMQLEWANQVFKHTNKSVLILCPLQLETIERAITLWSNKDDVVFSPFMGIGSEGYQSLKMDRKFIGFELKESYFNLAIKNMELAVTESKQLTFI